MASAQLKAELTARVEAIKVSVADLVAQRDGSQNESARLQGVADKASADIVSLQNLQAEYQALIV